MQDSSAENGTRGAGHGRADQRAQIAQALDISSVYLGRRPSGLRYDPCIPPILQTHRLRLRTYSIADEAGLFEVFADPYARRFYPEMADRAKVRAWIEWNLGNYNEFGFGLWAMEVKVEGRFVGDCGLTYQDVEGRRELEIGYHVLERERGRGYATEAARACLEFGFTHTSSENICSIVAPLNQASCAVAARVHMAQREFMKGGQRLLLFYTTRHEWEAVRS